MTSLALTVRQRILWLEILLLAFRALPLAAFTVNPQISSVRIHFGRSNTQINRLNFLPKMSLFPDQEELQRQPQPLEEAPTSRNNHRKDLVQAIENIQQLRNKVDDMDASQQEWRDVNDKVRRIEQILQQVETSSSEMLLLIPPMSLTMEEYIQAIQLWVRLPLLSRVDLCQRLGISDEEEALEAARDWERAPQLVAQLHQAYHQQEKDVTSMLQRSGILPSAQEFLRSTTDKKDGRSNNKNNLNNKNQPKKMSLASIFDNDTPEPSRKDVNVQQFLGRVARFDRNKEEPKTLTEPSLPPIEQVIRQVKPYFAVSDTELLIDGNIYLLRGQAKANFTTALLSTPLDDDSTMTFHYIPDVTGKHLEEGELVPENVLMVIPQNNFAPKTSRWILSLASALGVVSIFVFSMGMYGFNDAVTSRAFDGTTMGDFSGYTWFNGKILQVVVPILALQLMHDAGHWLVAWRDKLALAPPTLIPFWGLPCMGTEVQLKKSPSNLTSLFDFALAGPLVGLLASLACLGFGLELTATADIAATKEFPGLPVSLIRSSTLGATLVDYLLGGFGADGFITSQDPATPVPMHPLAIAGFTSLIINAISLLPQGSTDGGRLSLSLFGRQTSLIVNSGAWVVLLFTTLFVDNTDSLLGAWVIYNIFQNDPEIPCQNEVDQVDPFRAVTAFGLWFVAALTLFPLQ